jgi:tetratricopeptide (TPR) repeat protein
VPCELASPRAGGRDSFKGLQHGCDKPRRALGLQGVQSSIADYDQALLIDPHYADAYDSRSLVYDQSGDRTHAIADLNRLIELVPTNARAHLKLGGVYDAEGQYERAITEYNQAIEIQPAYIEAFVLRGDAYEAVGDNQRAVADFKTALSISAKTGMSKAMQWVASRALGGTPQNRETISPQVPQLSEPSNPIAKKEIAPTAPDPRNAGAISSNTPSPASPQPVPWSACEPGFRALADPWVNAYLKEALMEKLRNRARHGLTCALHLRLAVMLPDCQKTETSWPLSCFIAPLELRVLGALSRKDM